MARTVNGHKAAELIDIALDDFQTDMTEQVFKACSAAGKLAKKDLQSTDAYTDKSGDYRKGWAIRTKREKFGVTVLIYNKAKPGLTHLLEKGHDNARGGGRTPAHPHIKKARDKAAEYYLDEITKNI